MTRKSRNPWELWHMIRPSPERPMARIPDWRGLVLWVAGTAVGLLVSTLLGLVLFTLFTAVGSNVLRLDVF
jgi:hypothetical protein